MGIALPTTPGTRSAIVSTTYTVIALVFFFGVGLAGGTAYKLWSANDSNQQVADQQRADRQAANQPRLTPLPAPQTAFAAPSSMPTASLPTASDNAAGDNLPSLASPQTVAPTLAQLAPAAPPSVPPPPAPPADATVTAAPTDAAPPEAAPSEAAPSGSATPAPPHVVAAHRAPVPPEKPRLAAKAAHHAQVAALHAPPAAPGNAAGPFRVQFGAFANEENARRVQWAVEATGLKVEVTQAPGSTGQPLFYLRSPDFHDYAAALSAAQTVRDRVQHFVNAIPIDYAIMGDPTAVEQQAQAH